jgi:FKBP-type peptidyl-prolyl cis-trans isomerase 2
MAAFKLNYLHILAIIVVVAIIIAVVYMATNNNSGQVVAVNDTISVYYTGTLTNGTVFDSNVGKQPLNFTVGSGEIIKGFDEGVIGMKVNETKSVTIPANEAYGPVNPALIQEVPKSSFGNESIQKGSLVQGTFNGAEEQGTVTAINATTVTVDFNPPLAGQTLIFQIKIISIKKA